MKPLAVCCRAPLRARAGLACVQRVVPLAPLIYTPWPKKSSCKVMKLSPLNHLSKKTVRIHTHTHTDFQSCRLKYQSHECVRREHNRMIFALVTGDNGPSIPGWQVHVWKLYTDWKRSYQAHLHSFTSTTQTSDKDALLSDLYPWRRAPVKRKCACYCALECRR